MPRNGNYAKAHTKDWASKVFESDAIVVVTPQYNRSFPAPIKNAIDYLFAEWDAKPVALVGYGWTGASDATADLTKVLEPRQGRRRRRDRPRLHPGRLPRGRARRHRRAPRRARRPARRPGRTVDEPVAATA